MKTTIVFLVIIVLSFSAIYLYYLSTGGVPIEELVNEALGLGAAEEEGEGGLPIVVSLVPYFTIIVSFIAVGVLLELRKRKQK